MSLCLCVCYLIWFTSMSLEIVIWFYLYMSFQVSFCASVMRSLSTSSANPNLPVLLNQRVYHALVRDARVHLLLQQKSLKLNKTLIKTNTLTATIAPSCSLWYFALCWANPDFDPLTFPQILHGHGIPFIWVSVWRLRFACKKKESINVLRRKQRLWIKFQQIMSYFGFCISGNFPTDDAGPHIPILVNHRLSIGLV